MGKLVQVNTAIADGTSSALNVVGINTDDVYMVAINNIRCTIQTALLARVTKSGTPDSTANYDYAYKDLKAYDVFGNTSYQNANYLNFGTINSTYGASGIWYLYNFNSSSEYSFISQENLIAITGTLLFGQMGGSVHTVASASDGVSFYVGTGLIAIGSSATLYKVL